MGGSIAGCSLVKEREREHMARVKKGGNGWPFRHGACSAESARTLHARRKGGCPGTWVHR